MKWIPLSEHDFLRGNGGTMFSWLLGSSGNDWPLDLQEYLEQALPEDQYRVLNRLGKRYEIKQHGFFKQKASQSLSAEEKAAGLALLLVGAIPQAMKRHGSPKNSDVTALYSISLSLLDVDGNPAWLYKAFFETRRLIEARQGVFQETEFAEVAEKALRSFDEAGNFYLDKVGMQPPAGIQPPEIRAPILYLKLESMWAKRLSKEGLKNLIAALYFTSSDGRSIKGSLVELFSSDSQSLERALLLGERVASLGVYLLARELMKKFSLLDAAEYLRCVAELNIHHLFSRTDLALLLSDFAKARLAEGEQYAQEAEQYAQEALDLIQNHTFDLNPLRGLGVASPQEWEHIKGLQDELKKVFRT